MAKNSNNKEKAKWFGVLFGAILLFTIGLFTGNIIFTLLALPLAILVYAQGDSILFAEYNEGKELKRKEYEEVKKAHQKIVKEGMLFSKEEASRKGE